MFDLYALEIVRIKTVKFKKKLIGSFQLTGK
jgi:hypothetical protein